MARFTFFIYLVATILLFAGPAISSPLEDHVNYAGTLDLEPRAGETNCTCAEIRNDPTKWCKCEEDEDCQWPNRCYAVRCCQIAVWVAPSTNLYYYGRCMRRGSCPSGSLGGDLGADDGETTIPAERKITISDGEKEPEWNEELQRWEIN